MARAIRCIIARDADWPSRRVLVIDFAFWFSFAIFQTTFALSRQALRFDAARTVYSLASGCSARYPGWVHQAFVHRFGDKTTFLVGLAFGVVGLVGSA